MAAVWRTSHLDTFDIGQRVLATYQSQGIYLIGVELVRKLLYVEFHCDELTIVNERNDYSVAG